MSAPLLSIRDLHTSYATPDGEVRAVRGVSLDIAEGEAVGVVGETGSGKSQLFMSVMGLVASNGKVTGEALFDNEDLIALPQSRLARIRGNRIAIIFQNPMTSFNPYLRISEQMTEVLVHHKGMSKRNARAHALRMLDVVQIPEARRRFDLYPHEFSGGMRQRVMIAIALLCQPRVLIADEPTTALDVTIQARILVLLASIRKEFGTSIVLITHNLGVVAGFADRVAVMYAGRVVETGATEALFSQPRHPYTEALMRAMPRLDDNVSVPLPVIEGQPPDVRQTIVGCSFNNRCPRRTEICATEDPVLREVAARSRARCHWPAGAAT